MRHAMALADAERPPSQWELGPAARAQSADLALRARLGEVVGVVSSPEPKARSTAAAFAARVELPVRTDDRLAEVRRPWVGDGYRTAAHRYLGGDEPDGWEPRAEVAVRVASAIAERRAEAGSGELVVVSHGLALSLHLEALFRDPFDAYGFWRRLAFPDAWRVDHDQDTLARVATREDR